MGLHKKLRAPFRRCPSRPFPLILERPLVTSPMKLIYKISPANLWREAERAGVFTGAPVDRADGFIHFSTAEQVVETATKHFAGQGDLVLVAVDEEQLGEALRYEASRGGALFPHLHGSLPLSAVRWARPLPLGSDGRHVFPDLA